eukprot:scaffold45436_cov72-Phaeocystis_antarctica.AAC.3
MLLHIVARHKPLSLRHRAQQEQQQPRAARRPRRPAAGPRRLWAGAAWVAAPQSQRVQRAGPPGP